VYVCACMCAWSVRACVHTLNFFHPFVCTILRYFKQPVKLVDDLIIKEWYMLADLKLKFK